MTPLEQAQQQQKKGCATCAKRVVLRPRGASYCEVSEKLLLPSLLNCGKCAHVPSEYEPKGETMKTRENELHEASVNVFRSEAGYIAVQMICTCGHVLHDTEWVYGADEEELTKRAKGEIPNYCPNCGARLKEVDK